MNASVTHGVHIASEPIRTEYSVVSTRYEWFSIWTDQHLAITVTLARGPKLTDKVVLTAFGADPATIQYLSFDEADDDPAAPRVRFGRRNGWFHAIEHFTIAGTSDDVLRRISGDQGEAYSLGYNVALGTFQSSHDGRVTTRFNVGMPGVRYGADPDRHVEQMTKAGLMAPGPARPAQGAHLLELLTGFELDAGVLEAPLASAIIRAV